MKTFKRLLGWAVVGFVAVALFISCAQVDIDDEPSEPPYCDVACQDWQDGRSQNREDRDR